MVPQTLDEKLIGAEQPLDIDGRLSHLLADCAGQFGRQVAEILPVVMAASPAYPAVPLKQHLPPTKSHQASVERLFFPQVPLRVILGHTLLWVRRPKRRAISAP